MAVKIHNPIILAVETATDACSVAIIKNGQIISDFVVEPQAHSKLLLAMVNQLCNTASIVLGEVDAFAYGMGPGSFTGLRIAASAVQGLALGTGKPVIGISTLHALAQQALLTKQLRDASIKMLPILDARMQEVYWGVYSIDIDSIAAPDQMDALSAADLLVLNSEQKYLAMGTGLAPYARQLTANYPNLQLLTEIIYPRAEEVAQLAYARYVAGDFGSPVTAVPIYIRNNVAQTGKKNPDLGSRDKN